MSDEQIVCEKCGVAFSIGQSPFCRDGHGFVVPDDTLFSPYDDFALGEHVTSPAHRRQLMREKKLEYREKVSPGELSARRDRGEEKRKEER